MSDATERNRLEMFYSSSMTKYHMTVFKSCDERPLFGGSVPAYRDTLACRNWDIMRKICQKYIFLMDEISVFARLTKISFFYS